MITREDFNNLIEIRNTDIRCGTTARVYRFLLENRNTAYTSGEILKFIHVNQNLIIQALKSLSKRGFVRNNKPYWIIDKKLSDEEAQIKKEMEK